MKIIKYLLPVVCCITTIKAAQQTTFMQRRAQEMLQTAVALGSISAAEQALKWGADINGQAVKHGLTPLMRAAADGSLAMVKYLVEHGADVNLTFDDYKKYAAYSVFGKRVEIISPTALTLAGLNRHVDIVNYLLEKGADIDYLFSTRLTGLPADIQNFKQYIKHPRYDPIREIQKKYMHEEKVAIGAVQKKLEEKVGTQSGVTNIIGAFLGKPTKELNKQLLKAIAKGDVNTIKALQIQGINSIEGEGVPSLKLRYREEDMLTQYDTAKIPLIAALMFNQPEAFKILLNGTHSIYVLRIAVFLAASQGLTDILKILLEYQKKNNLQLLNGFTIQDLTTLQAAALNDKPKNVKLLLEAGANQDVVGERGITAFQLAKQNNLHDVVNVFNTFNQQAVDMRIFDAVKAKHMKEVDALLEEGIPVDSRDEENNTPLIIAAGFGDVQMIDFLIKHGADVNATNDFGITPILWATLHNKPRAVEKLLYAQADPNKKDNKGRNVYNIARKNVNILMILQDYANLPKEQRS